MILLLSRTTNVISDTETALQVDYEVSLEKYRGPYLVDAHIGFAEMLCQWPTPWEALDISGLRGPTTAQFFLAWAWVQNVSARYCLDGQAVAHGWSLEDATEVGVVAAVSAAKSLAHAKLLMAYRRKHGCATKAPIGTLATAGVKVNCT